MSRRGTAAALALVIVLVTALAAGLSGGRSGDSGGPMAIDVVSGVGGRAHEIYLAGRDRDNLPNVFSLVGDSISADSRFLVPFGQGEYDLGEYGNLAETVRYFAGPNGRGENPFVSMSLAVYPGWMTESVLNPLLADPSWCQRNEMPLVCEYRLARPSVALIMLGTNDAAGGRAVETYRANLRQIVDISIQMGVIPVLSTIPALPLDRHDRDRAKQFNQTIIETARDYQIPLWDYGRALHNAPDQGLSFDGIHPSAPPDGRSGVFDAEHLKYGYTIRNLTALQVLDQIRRQVLE